MFFFDMQRPCHSRDVVNAGVDNKLNSMDSVLVDIENVVIMWWALQPIAMAYLKPGQGQHDLFLSVLGNQSSHFDQPVLAYKRRCRAILYNNSGLKSM